MIMWSRLLLLNLRQNNCKVVTMQVLERLLLQVGRFKAIVVLSV